MKTFSALLAFCEGNPPVTGGSPSQRLVMRSFGVFFDLRLNTLNKRLNKSQVIWDAIALIMMWLYCACRMLCELISKTFVHNIALAAGHHGKSRRERLSSGKDRNHDPSLHEDCNRLALISACASHRLCRQVLDNKKSQSEFEGRKWVNCNVCYRCKRNMMVAHVLA